MNTTILLTFNFNSTLSTYDIKIASKRASERILDKYVNAYNPTAATLKKAKSRVAYFCLSLRCKIFTHLHIIYLINRVLLPQLEYLFQFSFFTSFQLEHLYSPIKKLFKQSFSLPISLQDNSIFNLLLPSINSLHTTQLIQSTTYTTNHKSPKISQKELYLPKNEWTTHWNSTTHYLLYGKSIQQENYRGSLSITYSEHWIHYILPQDISSKTPCFYHHINIPCNGCAKNTTFHCAYLLIKYYTTENINRIDSAQCPRCGKTEEDWDYIWICESNELTIREIIEEAIYDYELLLKEKERIEDVAIL
ncbi:hypothetical protein RclHR1_08720008 [Rhizophagus clarus]|uniref:Uncharacterized protein n=1 Tax=Rhizophagus clarus TaxID=94130 RepID=A0A2Z6SCQ9_9GLOM|nr:hypothetical protein RclHR1_08720008 [Rhizophagus clarus]